ncbi:Bug family tripartite tricarboxylate transporter substrate binding protein [Bradyrhizobium sp. USDA 4454]
MLSRRQLIFGSATFVGLAPSGGLSARGAWAPKQIEIYVPYAAGGGTDAIARLYASAIAAILHVPVIVVNKPGGRSIPAYQALLNGPTDGSTLLFDNSSNALQQLFRVPYDPFKDFQPVSLAAIGSSVLVVSPILGAETYQQFVERARAAPGSISFGSYGTGSISHLQQEVLSQSAKIQVQHVPYRGSAPALNDLVGGHVQALFADAVAALPLVSAGAVKAIASVGSDRVKTYPDVPTFGELGVSELSFPGWWGFFARRGVPSEVISTVGESISRAAKNPDMARLVDLGAESRTSSPEAFAGIIRRDAERWKDVVSARDIRLE